MLFAPTATVNLAGPLVAGNATASIEYVPVESYANVEFAALYAKAVVAPDNVIGVAAFVEIRKPPKVPLPIAKLAVGPVKVIPFGFEILYVIGPVG